MKISIGKVTGNGMILSDLIVEDSDNFEPYHTGITKIIKANDKFVVWDGEGANAPYKRRRTRHNYILFGCYNGVEHAKITSERLHLRECLEFIVEQGIKNPGANHVAFYFDYDVNMILNHLPVDRLQRLREQHFIRVTLNGIAYGIEHIPHKWFQVTRYGPKYDFKNRNGKGKRDKVTVRIQDMAGFFQCSLLKALKDNLSDHPYYIENIAEVEKGKDSRNEFTYADLETITSYWEKENVLFHALADHLRRMLYSVELRIKNWHGPGALANYTYKREGIRAHKADCGEDVYRASRFAYAGGRFELFRPGRHRHVYGIDINSAYPAAIAKLPSLSNGQWKWRDENNVSHDFAEFGLYNITMRGPIVGEHLPSPLFNRDKANIVSFPWNTKGWYWSPEIEQVLAVLNDMGHDLSDKINIDFHGGWEWIPNEPSYPFDFVRETFEKRKRLKAEGHGGQMALKLMMNSLYGKMAQRAGWERNGTAPTWHQLEWAGWVTSYVRAKLFSVFSRIPFDQLIAVETDGIYTTCDPARLGITTSKELGEWEVTKYDEVIYLQSGVYAMLKDGKWTTKYRGLDPDSVSTESIIEHAKLLGSNQEWPPLIGTTTRFVGYPAALFREVQNRGPTKAHHCKWETAPKEISIGAAGKRRHNPRFCKACEAGKTAYEMPHSLIIQMNLHYGTIESQMHDIPWLDRIEPSEGDEFSGEVFPEIEWREFEEEERGLLRA